MRLAMTGFAILLTSAIYLAVVQFHHPCTRVSGLLMPTAMPRPLFMLSSLDGDAALQKCVIGRRLCHGGTLFFWGAREENLHA